jgi:hypothetical protein
MSNFGYIALLVSKDGLYMAWRKVEASWTLKSSNLVQAARIDGAKEFTQGPTVPTSVLPDDTTPYKAMD